ncbi:hypothetical protein GE061_007329 [Apolygus lucorum]|uniref:CCHC-type domain-containing protein n=1 Tax=Apolygus lucorum TaxID=248454 RepID=A0A8S9WRN4_APOLU|nr:hypothetical protein GE061_007329 [Apolygus lucorum]
MSLNFSENRGREDDDTPSTANTEAVEVMTQTMREMNLLLQRLNTSSHENTRDEIPRSVFLEVEPWDPDATGAMSVTSFFANFDMVSADLNSRLKYRLLRTKTRGTAKQFLIDRDDSLDTDNVYEAARADMITWFQKENPQHAAALLWTVRRSLNETLRQFADRVRNLARCAVMEEGRTLHRSERTDWVEKRTLDAFIRGVDKQVSAFFVANRPRSIQEALKKAEELEQTLDVNHDTDEKWELAAVSGDQRCYNCGSLDHFAAKCPKKNQPLPRYQRRNDEDRRRERSYDRDDDQRATPRFPCMFCADRTHFPIACPFNPQKTIFCDFCGAREHLEEDCGEKKKLLPVSRPVMGPAHITEVARYKGPPGEKHIPAVEAPMSRTLKIRGFRCDQRVP